MVVGTSASPAGAATTISGRTSGDLVITPTDAPQTSDFADGAAWVIARMPNTRTISAVTLGHFGRATGCTTETTANLFIEELDDPAPVSGQIARSAVPAPIPTTPGRVRWSLRANNGDAHVTLRKNRSYVFRVQRDRGCGLRRTTWQHNAPLIDGGPHACASGPYDTTTNQVQRRFWHTAGTRETNCVGTGSIVAFPGPGRLEDLPSGWYVLLNYGFGFDQYFMMGQNFRHYPFPGVPDSEEVCRTATNRADVGVRPVSWAHRQVTEWVGRNPETGEDIYRPYTQWDVACAFPSYAPFGATVANGWFYAPPWTTVGAGQAMPRSIYVSLKEKRFTPDELLRRYSPVLRYDSQESFFTDAWQTATDGAKAQLRNRAANNAVLGAGALASGSPPVPTLTERWLQASLYPGTRTRAAAAHYLDFGSHRNVDMSNVAYFLRRENPAKYADKVYGRTLRGRNGALYLQYFFWYLYNDASSTGASNHEGDWENIQIRVDAAGKPVFATYTQHGKPHTCAWDLVQRTVQDRPLVFPARGRHASHFDAGEHKSGVPSIGDIWLSPDTSDGAGPLIQPGVIVMTGTPAFMTWPGFWGASSKSGFNPLESPSPRSPVFQKTGWADPVKHETDGFGTDPNDDYEGCVASARGATAARSASRRLKPGERRPTRLAATSNGPRLTAARVGSTLRITYATGRTRDDDLLVVSAHGRNRNTPAISRSIALPARRSTRGVTTLDVSATPGPYLVRASIFTRSGRSRIITTTTR